MVLVIFRIFFFCVCVYLLPHVYHFFIPLFSLPFLTVVFHFSLFASLYHFSFPSVPTLINIFFLYYYFVSTLSGILHFSSPQYLRSDNLSSGLQVIFFFLCSSHSFNVILSAGLVVKVPSLQIVTGKFCRLEFCFGPASLKFSIALKCTRLLVY